LNIDTCRIAGKPWTAHIATGLASEKFFTKGDAPQIEKNPHSAGRWPANVLLDDGAADALDEQAGELTSGKPSGMKAGGQLNCYGTFAGGIPVTGYGDTGGASRFFYVAKPSRAERDLGCGGLPLKVGGVRSETSGQHITRRDGGAPGPVRNHHPTVKPVQLMRYLCKLVTPPGGLILDCFVGSGTTAMAAKAEGFRFVGIEREAEYIAIARAREAAMPTVDEPKPAKRPKRPKRPRPTTPPPDLFSDVA
jgi:site-specific DNA-methyltransferase (adenine-specific)